MGYSLPKFNLVCGVFGPNNGPTPIAGPPRFTTICQLRSPKKTEVAGGNAIYVMYLCLPALTDVRVNNTGINQDWVECPSGSGRWYLVTWVDDVAKGFANEYRCAILEAQFPLPVPLP